MNYEDDQFYDSYSEFDEKINEFKQSLLKDVKQEFIEELNRLKKENSELQEIKNNFESIKKHYTEKELELSREKQNAMSEARKLQLNRLFKDREIVLYRTEGKYIKKPKCNKCNNDRKIKYVSPLGKEMFENCDCSNSDMEYVPKPWILFEFKMTYDKELLMWYKEEPSGNETYFESCSQICKDIYNDSIPYEKVSYDTFFRDKEDCQKYCDWKNKKQ
jgi:regulator of replication initiation timing